MNRKPIFLNDVLEDLTTAIRELCELVDELRLERISTIGPEALISERFAQQRLSGKPNPDTTDGK